MADKIDKKIRDTVARMTSTPSSPKRRAQPTEVDRRQRLTEKRIARLVGREQKRQAKRQADKHGARRTSRA